MEYVNYKVNELMNFCKEVFTKLGFTPDDADIITDSLITSDLYGIKSHGIQRLMRYYNSIKRNSIHVNAKPEVVFETPVSAVIDGHSGMGQIIAAFANNLALEKAKKVGMAFGTVRNYNHYGIAGYYTKKAFY